MWLIVRPIIMRMFPIAGVRFDVVVKFRLSMIVASVPWCMLEIRTHQPHWIWNGIRWKPEIRSRILLVTTLRPYAFNDSSTFPATYLLVKLDKYGFRSIFERNVDDWNNKTRRTHKQNANFRNRVRCNIAIGPSKLWLTLQRLRICVGACECVCVCVCGSEWRSLSLLSYCCISHFTFWLDAPFKEEKNEISIKLDKMIWALNSFVRWQRLMGRVNIWWRKKALRILKRNIQYSIFIPNYDKFQRTVEHNLKIKATRSHSMWPTESIEYNSSNRVHFSHPPFKKSAALLIMQMQASIPLHQTSKMSTAINHQRHCII